MRAQSKSCGFSFTELMVVVTVLAIITAVGVYSLAGTRRRSLALECRGNLQMLHNAVTTYALERHLAYGAIIHMTNLYPRYLSPGFRARCPASGTAYGLQFTNGVPPTCPSAAIYTNHVWEPAMPLGL